ICFAEVDFFLYRFSTGLLEEEIRDALTRYDGNIHLVIEEKEKLELRQALIPTLEVLGDPQHRICCGGIGVVFALRTPGEYLIPLQVRSGEVSDGRGSLAVIPKAFHQPLIGDPQEVNIYWTTL